ncbi:hypothetical protein Ancab_002930 [Ancistrocladus abbreviatus]
MSISSVWTTTSLSMLRWAIGDCCDCPCLHLTTHSIMAAAQTVLSTGGFICWDVVGGGLWVMQAYKHQWRKENDLNLFGWEYTILKSGVTSIDAFQLSCDAGCD